MKFSKLVKTLRTKRLFRISKQFEMQIQLSRLNNTLADHTSLPPKREQPGLFKLNYSKKSNSHTLGLGVTTSSTWSLEEKCGKESHIKTF